MDSTINFSRYSKAINFLLNVPLKPEEEIKEITTYNADERYFISNYGYVYSLCRNVPIKLKTQYDLNGYAYISISYKGESKNVRIHKLVADYFIYNDSPQTKVEVHHIDLNKRNNHFSNLIHLTPQEHRKIHANLRKETKDV